MKMFPERKAYVSWYEWVMVAGIVVILAVFLISCVSICNGQMWEGPTSYNVEKTCEICGAKYMEWQSNIYFKAEARDTHEDVTYLTISNIDLCDSCREKYAPAYAKEKLEIDEKYRLKLRICKEDFLKEYKEKEKATIEEIERTRKEQRLAAIVEDKEIEAAKEKLNSLIREKERLEKEGIKPDNHRYCIGYTTATLRTYFVTTSTQTIREAK